MLSSVCRLLVFFNDRSHAYMHSMRPLIPGLVTEPRVVARRSKAREHEGRGWESKDANQQLVYWAW